MQSTFSSSLTCTHKLWKRLHSVALFHMCQTVASPNLSNFSALRNLTILNYALFTDNPSIACSKLSGPVLTHVTIDHMQGGFDDGHARWLTQFARCWHSGSRLRKPLYIHVSIQRKDSRTNSGFCHESREVWFRSSIRCLTDIWSELAKYGIYLTWDRIFLTEAEWIQQVGQVRYGSFASQRINQYAEEKAKEQQNLKTYQSKFTLEAGMLDWHLEVANTDTF